MKLFHLFSVTFLIVLMLLGRNLPAAEKQDITLQLPEATLADVLTRMLPIQIDRPHEMIKGTLAIDKISRLKLDNNAVSALVSLTGHDLQVTTDIAGQQLRLNIGTVEMDCALSATLRYDRATQTLFITPQISTINSEGNANNGKAGALLAGLLNGREIPVTIDRLQPIVTNAGGKKVTIKLKLAEVAVVPHLLTLYLRPTITATDIVRQ